MKRFCCLLLFLVVLPNWLHADCQPSKDSRKNTNKTAGVGIEVVDVLFSGGVSVELTELTKIKNHVIGSCFDDSRGLENQLAQLFHMAGFVSARIEDFKAEELSAEIKPTPVLVRGNVIEGDRCPTNLKAAYQFLLDHRADSLVVDPQCVDATFSRMWLKASFSDERAFYIKAMVNLLDFERKDEDPEFTHHYVQYPATESLHLPAAVPYLVDAIKRSDSGLVRANAVDTMLWISESRECMPATVSRLNREAEKPETTPEQKLRLQSAAEYASEYVRSLNGGQPPSCKSENGEPSTVEKVRKELESEFLSK